MKITVFGHFLRNVTDKPDTEKSVIFEQVLVKKCHFRTFPLGLDRGFGHSVTPVHAWCPDVSQWCQNGQNDEKSLGLDRDFDENDEIS